MLEIILIVIFFRKLKAAAIAKGHSGAYGALGIVLWLMGEFVGVVLGSWLDLGIGTYFTAIICAGMGMLVAFMVVNALDPKDESDKPVHL